MNTDFYKIRLWQVVKRERIDKGIPHYTIVKSDFTDFSCACEYAYTQHFFTKPQKNVFVSYSVKLQSLCGPLSKSFPYWHA